MLSPPSSKKLSSSPTGSTPSTSANSEHRSASCGVRGARGRPAGGRSEPAAPDGPACHSASTAGDPARQAPTAPCSPASRADSAARSEPHPAQPPGCQPHSHQTPLARGSSRATTAASATPASPNRAASISPGSIRNPRSLTCASDRPTNSRTPSRRHRPTSPVRYIRQPAAPNGSATNRSDVKPNRQDNPAPIPSPQHKAPPHTPAGTGLKPPSKT